MDKELPAEVRHYLERKSFRHWQLEWNKDETIEAVIVIPAICEFENIKTLLQSLTKNDKNSLSKTLVIFVINNSDKSSQESKENNKLTIDYLRQFVNRNPTHELSDEVFSSELKLGLVDATSVGYEFSEKLSGVGLARKVGMDLALKAFDYSIPGKKVIISLDADCIVDKNYIHEVLVFFKSNSISVANIEFEHNLLECGIDRCGIISYEIYLRHYVAGLLFAKSPFAFHTVGSSLVCDHDAYIAVGGMNTKKAAEDFYFLQKLAKYYKIGRIISTRVRPSSRESWRVPFGTGRTMMEISSNRKSILVYDPDIYVIIKNWLELFYSDLSLDINLLLTEARNIHPELSNFLIRRNFNRDWTKILTNSKSAKQLNNQRLNLFDAFETLKLVHYLRDKSFPMMEINSGVKKLFQIVNYTPNFDFEINNNNSKDGLLSLLNKIRTLELHLHKEMN